MNVRSIYGPSVAPHCRNLWPATTTAYFSTLLREGEPQVAIFRQCTTAYRQVHCRQPLNAVRMAHGSILTTAIDAV
jgi:hypothetical protein